MAVRIFARIVLAVAGGLALAGAAAAAPLPWREASSAHFVIYSQESAESLRAYAEKLERFDGALRRLFPGATAQPISADRLTIYSLPTVRALRDAMGNTVANAAGVYAAHAAGSVALTSREDDGDHSKFALTPQIILLHEYTHHFMLHNFAAAYPRWFVEGFAEFTSTALFLPDGGVGIGLPAAHRTLELHMNDQLAFGQLVNDDFKYRSGLEGYSLYGRGWLLTHYLIVDPARQGQLQRYLGLINDGRTPAQAAAATFGDPVRFERDLEAYQRRPTLSYTIVPADRLGVGEIDVRELGPIENAILPFQMRSRYGVTRQEARQLLAGARATAAAYPSDVAAQCMLAEAADDARDYDLAERAAALAVAAAPGAYCALLDKGMAAMDRAHDADAAAADPAWAAARGWFVKANHADLEQPLPMFLYYRTYQWSHAKPTANAVDALAGSAARAPQDDEVRLVAAVQFLRDDQPRAAKLMLAPVASSAHGGKFATAVASVYQAVGTTPAAALAAKLEAALATSEAEAKRR